jgi:hypothetical protein
MLGIRAAIKLSFMEPSSSPRDVLYPWKCWVLHSVAAPARVSRAALPSIQNSMAPLAYLPPSAESTCGSVPGRLCLAKVSRTEPVGETTADPKRSIPWIAKECAKLCETQYTDAALSKNAHQKIHSIFSADGRSAELDKANYQSKEIDADHVFVFDDIITRGDTLSRVALAVIAANPKCKVYGIAFAKAESVAYCPNPDNDQVPARWDTLWNQGEQEHDAKFK